MRSGCDVGLDEGFGQRQEDWPKIRRVSEVGQRSTTATKITASRDDFNDVAGSGRTEGGAELVTGGCTKGGTGGEGEGGGDGCGGSGGGGEDGKGDWTVARW